MILKEIVILKDYLNGSLLINIREILIQRENYGTT